MSKKDERAKPKYEAPTVVPLGELARGAGDCIAGTNDQVNCTAGTNTVTFCKAGGAALVHCEAGSVPAS